MLDAGQLDHRYQSAPGSLRSAYANLVQAPALSHGECPGAVALSGANIGFLPAGAVRPAAALRPIAAGLGAELAFPRAGAAALATKAAQAPRSARDALPGPAGLVGSLGSASCRAAGAILPAGASPHPFVGASAKVPGRSDAARFATPREIALPPICSRGHTDPAPLCGRGVVRRGFSGLDAALKRAFDLVVASLLLLVALPLLVAVAAALQLDSPGPILFVQRRLGRGGQPFGCIKLRTMRIDAERHLAALLAECPRARREWAADHKLRNDPRVSRLGRLVRKLSLDELPQLANVLAGQMSMVGPRPIVEAEVARYGAFYPDYCAVKPGLTGLWQVSGRNDVSYGDRVQFDRHYARHASFRADLAIALRTVPAVLFASGSY